MITKYCFLSSHQEMGSFVYDKVKKRIVQFQNPIHLYVKEWNVSPSNIPDLLSLDKLISNSLSSGVTLPPDIVDIEKSTIRNPLNDVDEDHIFPLKRVGIRHENGKDGLMNLLSKISMTKRHFLLPFAAVKKITPVGKYKSMKMKLSSVPVSFQGGVERRRIELMRRKNEWDFDVFASHYVNSGGSILELLPNTEDIIDHNSYLGHQYLMTKPGRVLPFTRFLERKSPVIIETPDLYTILVHEKHIFYKRDLKYDPTPSIHRMDRMVRIKSKLGVVVVDRFKKSDQYKPEVIGGFYKTYGFDFDPMKFAAERYPSVQSLFKFHGRAGTLDDFMKSRPMFVKLRDATIEEDSAPYPDNYVNPSISTDQMMLAALVCSLLSLYHKHSPFHRQS